MMILLLILIAMPVAEIYLFIEVGGSIGVGRTIGIVIITAVIGGYLLKREGRAVLGELQKKAEAGDDVSETLVQGVLVLLSGALLLTPGFLTDAVGFLMILPISRKYIGKTITQYIITHFKSRMATGSFFYQSSSSASRPDDIDVVDADYEEIPPKPSPPNSGDDNDNR